MAHELSVGDLDEFYRQARAEFDASEEFRERSRRRVVLLQSGDPETLRLWRVLVDQSVAYFEEVYTKLGVLLTRDDVVGESFYNDLLPVVVRELDDKGLLVESEGALCVFLDGYTNREGEPLPLIVRKSDGGYGYAASDLACLRDRFGRLGADLALYVVGAPQAQHLSMAFDVAALAGCIPEGRSAVHVAFGSMLGADRKMFRTRAGENVKLVDLLDEAVVRAAAAVDEKNPDLSPAERQVVARMVGIGAVKYADLSTDRIRDYVFDWDRMLAFEGNTAPYLQYARVRCLSIFRRGEIDPEPYAWGRVPVQYRRTSRTGAGFGPARLAGRLGRHLGDVEPAQVVHLPFRTGRRLHHLLRDLSRAESRDRRGPRQPAGLVCLDRQGLGSGPRSPRHRGTGPHVGWLPRAPLDVAVLRPA